MIFLIYCYVKAFASIPFNMINFAAPEKYREGSAFRIREDYTIANRGYYIQDKQFIIGCLIKIR